MQAHNSKQPVVVTGFDCITAAGHSFAATWDAINKGQSAIDKVAGWDISDYEYQLAAEIKDYQPRKMVADRKLLKLISKHDVFGLYSVSKALEHSDLLNHRDSLADATQFNDRTGIYVGSPGLMFNQQYDFFPLLSEAKRDMRKFGEGLFETVHPMWILKILSNNVLAYTGIQYGFKGANHNVVNHACGGAQALLEATRALQNGIVDRAVVVAYESVVEPQNQIYFGNIGVLSNQGIRCFDKKRDGTVLGEAAGTIILETQAAAEARGATIYGEILGGATTSEAMGVFPIREDGDGLLRTIEKGLVKSEISAHDVGMVCAHANGTVNSDATEAQVLNKVFDDIAIPVTGFKWCLGHTIAAGGVVDSMLTLQSLNAKTVPGIATLEQPADDCKPLSVSSDIQTPLSSIGLVISRGFSGINTCVLIKGVQ